MEFKIPDLYFKSLGKPRNKRFTKIRIECMKRKYDISPLIQSALISKATFIWPMSIKCEMELLAF